MTTTKKVLIVKTSSMGDVIHTLPALTDAAQHDPHIQFDWVVEEGFSEIPQWHKQVNRVIPVAVRRWRKHPIKTLFSDEWKCFRKAMKHTRYDAIIDAQGLTKSAVLARMAIGPRYGLDRHSARDKLAFIHYHQRLSIPWDLHAVQRVRDLFAKSLGYTMPTTPPDYGIREHWAKTATPSYAVFLHATTWATKLWPVQYWRELAHVMSQAGYHIYLNSGTAEEYERAKNIAEGIEQARAMPRKTIAELAKLISGAKIVVALDTGLAHLAAALGVPTVSLYSATDPRKTGTFGVGQYHLHADFPCAPCLQQTCTYTKASVVQPACFASINPDTVWRKINDVLTG